MKFQASRCKSFVKDTKDFLNKINGLPKLTKNATLVTMDVVSLYTNIDQDEGAQACYEQLETRKNKRVPSILLKKLNPTGIKV